MPHAQSSTYCKILYLRVRHPAVDKLANLDEMYLVITSRHRRRYHEPTRLPWVRKGQHGSPLAVSGVDYLIGVQVVPEREDKHRQISTENK